MGSRSRFVSPDTTILHISEGDTLVVRRKLNAGEQRRAYARMSTFDEKGDRRVDRLTVPVAMVAAYLLDWSLVDVQGSLVPIAGLPFEELVSVLDKLDPDVFKEIQEAIEAHDEKTRGQSEREKNAQDGANESPAISPSPVDAAGDTSGSLS